MILKKKEINRLRQNIDFKHILYIETLLEIKKKIYILENQTKII